jgi:quinohemoprotein ethanol dehydrogenase
VRYDVLPAVRRFRVPLLIFGSLLLAGAVVMVSHRQEQPLRQIRPAPAFTAAQLLALPTTGWLTNGGNLYNQRYSALTQINNHNVENLKAVWRTHLNGSGLGPDVSGQGQPLVHEGVLYITTGESDVFALDVESGAILWEYAAKIDPKQVNVCCGWVNRGVALGDGKVFVGQVDAKLVALDQRTGEVVWSIQAEDPLKGFSIVSAPLYYDGLIITGFGGGDVGIRGRVKAFDARTGALRWTFYTIPAPGEFGSETWPKNSEVWKYGGAPVWQTPAVDPELGLVYFSTGNAAPDYNGSVRPGDNLFTASILAIDAKTGAYRWHFQQVHHDIWDYDSPNPVVLFDVMYGGEPRKALAEVSKTGWVYILDRVNGKPLIGIEERPVPQEPRQATAATQPFPIGDALVPQHVDVAPEGHELVNGGRIFTPFWDKMVVFRPQMAVNWPPSSYDPETDRLFICGIDSVGTAFSDQKGFSPPTFDGGYMGGGGPFSGVVPERGLFSAVDLKTNRLVWQQQWPERCFSGSIATAGGLLFVGRSDGRFTALDKKDGRKLWEFQTDAGVNATASTFMHRGRQYVAVLSAGSTFAGKRGDSVWLFSLSGTLEAAAATRESDYNVVFPKGEPDIANGKRLYRQYCVTCHGNEGLGGHGGGASLVNAAKDKETVFAVATAGRNGMPPFYEVLQREELRDISTYITEELF